MASESANEAQLSDFFDGAARAAETFGVIRAIIERFGPIKIQVSKSQVAFRRRRSFAFVWLPGKYLRRPAAPVVLSIATPTRLESPRFKEVIQPSPRTWMHHLELSDASVIDAEVCAWLRQAFEAAG